MTIILLIISWLCFIVFELFHRFKKTKTCKKSKPNLIYLLTDEAMDYLADMIKNGEPLTNKYGIIFLLTGRSYNKLFVKRCGYVGSTEDGKGRYSFGAEFTCTIKEASDAGLITKDMINIRDIDGAEVITIFKSEYDELINIKN